MGSGKTAVGGALTHLTQMPLLDSDQHIESSCQKGIADMFASDGEAFFRGKEAEFCKTLAKISPRVISTGGGIILSEENQKALKENGIVIWLQAAIPTLIARLQNDTTRPLLKESNLEEKLKTLLTQRESLYKNTADLIFDVDKKTPNELANEIYERTRVVLEHNPE